MAGILPTDEIVAALLAEEDLAVRARVATEMIAETRQLNSRLHTVRSDALRELRQWFTYRELSTAVGLTAARIHQIVKYGGLPRRERGEFE